MGNSPSSASPLSCFSRCLPCRTGAKTKDKGAQPQRSSTSVGLLYDPRMAKHRNLQNGSHPEQPLRIARIFERLEKEGLAARCVRIECREASRAELELKHSQNHIDAMLSLRGQSESFAINLCRDYNSVYLCPMSTEAGLLSAGSVIEATARVCSGEVASAVCVVRPPGHHAEEGCAMGFCMFGNVALAAAEARRCGWSQRALIVDWDVHHGNGTQKMFHDDPSVLYFSTHRHDEGRFYPGGELGNYTSHGVGAGAGFSANVPWNVNGGKMQGFSAPGDAEFALAWERVLLPMAKDFQPDLVLVSAGFDSALGDPLGGCNITASGYHHLTRQLMGIAGGRMVVALEGGYNLESISASMAACTMALLGDDLPPHLDKDAAAAPPCPFHARKVDEVRRHLARFWPSLRVPLETRGPAAVPPMDPSEVPASALVGGVMQMQLQLRQYAEASGGNYDDLRLKHEAIVFKLHSVPDCSPKRTRRKYRVNALRQSFARVCCGPRYVIVVINVQTPTQAVTAVTAALSLGAHGVLLVDRTYESPDDERDNAQGQLSAFRSCFNEVRDAHPHSWVGVSIPQLDAAQAFTWVSENCTDSDALWLHDLPCKPANIVWETVGFGRLAQQIAVRLEQWFDLEDLPNLDVVRRAKSSCGWLGLVLGTVAGPGQEEVHHHQSLKSNEDMSKACKSLLCHWAALASSVCDVVIATPTESARGDGCTGKLDAMAAAKPLGYYGAQPLGASNADIILLDSGGNLQEMLAGALSIPEGGH